MIEAAVTEFHIDMENVTWRYTLPQLHAIFKVRKGRNEEAERDAEEEREIAEHEAKYDKRPGPGEAGWEHPDSRFTNEPPLSSNPHIANADELTMEQHQQIWGKLMQSAQSR